MQNPPSSGDGQHSGALGLGQSFATRIYCLFYIFYYSVPILVAIVADSLLGRYMTLTISMCIYCLGCVALTVTSLPERLDQGWGFPGLITAMAFIGLGAGGFRVTAVPLMIDQYERKPPYVAQTRTEKYTVTDYELTVQWICTLYYWYCT